MKTYDIECEGEIHTIVLSPDGTLDAMDHDMEHEQVLIDMGEEPSRCMEVILQSEDDPEELMSEAIEDDDTEIVRLLVDAGASSGLINVAFHVAATYNAVGAMEILYDAGVSNEALNEALRNSSEEGNVDAIDFTLDHGADIHTKNGYPLLWSVDGPHEDAVMLLLERGADPNLSPRVAYSLVRRIARKERYNEEAKVLLKALLDYGLDMDAAIDDLGKERFYRRRIPLHPVAKKYDWKKDHPSVWVRQWWEENRELYEDDD
jgi:ankyrin repeat protein